MPKLTVKRLILLLAGALLLAGLVYSLPPVQKRLSWRIDLALAYLRGVINPVEGMPTPLTVDDQPAVTRPGATSTPTARTTATPEQTRSTPTLQPSPTQIPGSISLPAPAWEKQDINNCGPASLAMYLRYYGWDKDQFDIANLLKPQRDDRNVNVDELAYYVRTRAGWLNAEYRVGGDLTTLKKLLAAGIPVIIEESFYFDEPFWPNDDLWAAHYNLITGYDDASQTFTGQDSFHGADQKIPYTTLEEYWHTFNHVYLMVYPPEREATVRDILGEQWDPATNRQRALEGSQRETQSHPSDPFAWFNLGSQLVYFERYADAASAFDKARELGLPQRMLRYQFSPFFAYFHTGRNDELLALTEYALQITPNAEEALLWHGWALYRDGDTAGALADFQNALVQNPNYQDAQYALQFVRENP